MHSEPGDQQQRINRENSHEKCEKQSHKIVGFLG